ncbi:MAG: LacI family DNA-binding transcriptional regulator, partial [Planctomycetota bacterium]
MAKHGKNTIRQKEIAKQLNLSVGTISKAFSNSTDINEQTRAKVINTASKMGYKFDSRSKKAISGKSYFVGVLIYGYTDDWQHTTYFAGMSERCARM